jgi:uncharacterized protein (DUF58 family)
VKNRVLFRVSLVEATAGISFILLLTVMGMVIWWMRPIKVFEVMRPIQVLSPNLAQGGDLTYEMSYCKYQDLDAQVYYSFNDSIAFAIEGGSRRTLAMGCHVTLERLMVPLIPPGVYRLEMLRVYRTSPLRQVEVKSLSQEFRIVQ